MKHGERRSHSSYPGGRTAKQWLRHIEEHAAAIRKRAQLNDNEPLHPHSVAKLFGVSVIVPADVPGISDKEVEAIRSMDPKTWSGAGVPLGNGSMVVILHPDQTPERANVTLMEEIAHQYFGHLPAQLEPTLDNISARKYDSDAENEAYWTAAATLLPSKVVAQAVWRRESAQKLASRYGVSTELVQFRVKILGLWSEHQSRAA